MTRPITPNRLATTGPIKSLFTINNSREIWALISLITFIFFMPACSTLKSKPSSDTVMRANSSITAWSINGKIGIRTDTDGGSAHLRWLQNNDAYELSLSGPLGQGAATIRGSKNKVSLNSAKTGILTATTPEELLQQAFGWNVPISNLFYWVKGIPSPQAKKSIGNIKYNEEGQLESFTQEGWQIQYSRYRNIEGWALPHKTILQQQNIKVTLIIAHWDLTHSSISL